MHHTRKIPLVQLNDFFTCRLCRGYYIDATTIIECLHTFCRSCIVQYLEKNKYCPVCDVQVHKSKPLLNIRPDKIIQDIVYKLVPRLFQNEMCKRREFYSVHPEGRPSNLEQCGEASYQHILRIDETICVTLAYSGSTGPPRYLRCPAGLSVVHLQKLLRSKYGLPDRYRVDIFHNQDCLSPYLTLADIAYIYLWRRKGPLEFTYRIYENSLTNLTVDALPSTDLRQPIKSVTDTTTSESVIEQDRLGTNWKEVQLRISETGEMCFTNIDSSPILNEEVTKSNKSTSELLPNSDQEKSTDVTNNDTENTNLSDAISTKTDEKVAECTKESTSSISTNVGCDNKPSVIENCVSTTSSTCTSISTSTDCTSSLPCDSVKPTNVTADTELLFNGKHKTPRDTEEEPVTKQPKQTILNHTLSLGINHLSNNHPLKRNSQIRKSVESTSSSDTCIESSSTTVSRTAATNSSLVINSTHCSSIQSKPTIINKECNSIASISPAPQWLHNKTPNTKLPCYSPKVVSNPVINIPKVQNSSNILKSKVPITTILNHKMALKNKPVNSVGYKTLREPPKTWNPQLPRSLLLKGTDQKEPEAKNTKPAKFFKMRNNMPRYLGNPASGVKPLYHVHNSPEKDKSEESVKTDKSEIKKHSIVKIDPKTLKPISEKAPESSSLSSHNELKINTSSVPIFSPLKLQSSPRSPKSPQSPKTKTSPSSKREKLNLNYIPPNPFIPNLASPTLSPNQFLYPPGFPTYDHRLVAAYHNLLFGQRFAFPASHPIPNLNYDLSQRKAFDVPPCTTSSSQFSKEKSGGKREPEVHKPQNAESSSVPSNITHEAQHSNKVKKKQSKELAKNEKSLKNTVEKLTQNRVNELKKVDSSSDKNGIEKESKNSESPIPLKDEKNVSSKEKNSVRCETGSNVDTAPVSNNCTNNIDDTSKCSQSKTELETLSDTQSMQNGDKTVSNNNTIESVSLQNVDNV